MNLCFKCYLLFAVGLVAFDIHLAHVRSFKHYVTAELVSYRRALHLKVVILPGILLYFTSQRQ